MMTFSKKPNVLFIDELLINDRSVRVYLGEFTESVDYHIIGSYYGLQQVMRKGVSQFDMVVFTPSFIVDRGENVWLNVLPKFRSASQHLPIVFVAKNLNSQRQMRAIDPGLITCNRPEEVRLHIKRHLF